MNNFLKFSAGVHQLWGDHIFQTVRESTDEGEVADFSAKSWDCRSSEAPRSSSDAQVVGPYQVSNPLRLTVPTVKTEDYTPVFAKTPWSASLH